MIDRQMALQAGEKKAIRVEIMPVPGPGETEVSIFASDQEESLFECMMFKIKYVL